MLMDTLRVLLIERDPRQAESIAAMLAGANHSVHPATGLDEASEALSLQKFDAVLLRPPLPAQSVADFTSKLRELEKRSRAPLKAPVLSFCAKISDERGWSAASEMGIDGYLCDSFVPSELVAAVTSLARVEAAGKGDISGKPVFEADGFKAQVGNDDKLVVELIDLFMSEIHKLRSAMEDAVGSRDYEQLYRVAHTIKGSLGSLHAERAGCRAEQLESAAKAHASEKCVESFCALMEDLDALEPHLAGLRGECCASAKMLS